MHESTSLFRVAPAIKAQKPVTMATTSIDTNREKKKRKIAIGHRNSTTIANASTDTHSTKKKKRIILDRKAKDAKEVQDETSRTAKVDVPFTQSPSRTSQHDLWLYSSCAVAYLIKKTFMPSLLAKEG